MFEKLKHEGMYMLKAKKMCKNYEEGLKTTMHCLKKICHCKMQTVNESAQIYQVEVAILS